MTTTERRAALVTGAGSGIGRAIAHRLAKEGYDVGLLDRDADALEATAKNLVGDTFVTRVADVTEAAAVDDAVDAVIDRFGGLDVLVCNHGVGKCYPVLDETLENWNRTLLVNLTGAFLIARASLPHLIKRKGTVVAVSAINATLAAPGWPAYCASKSGLNALMRSIAADYGPLGVRANSVSPGWVRTSSSDQELAAVAEAWDTDIEGAYQLCTSHAPLGRPAEPAEVSAVVAFLAGEDASYLSGIEVAVDGGATALDATTTPFRGAPLAVRRVFEHAGLAKGPAAEAGRVVRSPSEVTPDDRDR